MSRSRPTNVPHRPNRSSPPTFAVQSQVLLRRTRLPESTVVRGSISARMAATLVRQGLGEDEHMRRLAYALNMSMLLCHLKILPADLPSVIEAQEALMIAHSHSHAVKRWVIPDVEFDIICGAISVYERQLAFASQAQIIAADRELVRLRQVGEMLPSDAESINQTARV